MGWKDIQLDLDDDSPSPPNSGRSSRSNSPPRPSTSATTWLDASDMLAYGPGGLGPGPRTVQCNDCNKPVADAAFAEHKINCKKVREAKQQLKRTGSGTDVHGESNKKRRLSDADSDSASSPATSKKPKSLNPDDKALTKPGDPKKRRKTGPVDVNTQCGVITEADNRPCARSLTCKKHGIRAQEAVPGRSAPFKVLQAQMANAKKSSTTTTTATPTKASTLPPGTVITNGRTGLPGVIDVNKAKGIKRPITFGEILSDSEEGDEAKEGQGDSEDEVEQVFAGLQTASQFCRPVATTTYGGAMLLRAIKYGRYREQLFSSNPGR